MAARLQAADRGGGPVLLLTGPASGDLGGTTISATIEQSAQKWAFLMDALDMKAPGSSERVR